MNKRKSALLWHVYGLGIFVLALIISGYVFVRFYVRSAHADFESTIYVPDYNKIDELSNKVTPELIVGIGPQITQSRDRINKVKTQQQARSQIIASVNVHYKTSRPQAIFKNKSLKKSPVKPRPDWYIEQFPKSRRDYLLKVRHKKIAWLKAFFVRYRSPLKANVYDFVYASEYYGIDYRLLPAISIVESSGGKYLFRPYNPFGWGRHGYKNFHDAIWDVARGLSVYHYRLNRTTPESIGRLYNPVTPTHWARKVRYLMNLMPKY